MFACSLCSDAFLVHRCWRLATVSSRDGMGDTQPGIPQLCITEELESHCSILFRSLPCWEPQNTAKMTGLYSVSGCPGWRGPGALRPWLPLLGSQQWFCWPGVEWWARRDEATDQENVQSQGRIVWELSDSCFQSFLTLSWCRGAIITFLFHVAGGGQGKPVHPSPHRSLQGMENVAWFGEGVRVEMRGKLCFEWNLWLHILNVLL